MGVEKVRKDDTARTFEFLFRFNRVWINSRLLLLLLLLLFYPWIFFDLSNSRRLCKRCWNQETSSAVVEISPPYLLTELFTTSKDETLYFGLDLEQIKTYNYCKNILFNIQYVGL